MWRRHSAIGVLPHMVHRGAVCALKHEHVEQRHMRGVADDDDDEEKEEEAEDGVSGESDERAVIGGDMAGEWRCCRGVLAPDVRRAGDDGGSAPTLDALFMLRLTGC